MRFQGQDLLTMEAEDRARGRDLLGFQYPVEIPGVTNSAFLASRLQPVQVNAARTSSIRSSSTTSFAKK